ncbi:GGDEF domain-containing protein [Marinobacter sp.]|uniref:GGDEF domain-containing protein n=1 Tax=Marinobacter sp. TaxID=50741 RepID=UPI003568D1F6
MNPKTPTINLPPEPGSQPPAPTMSVEGLQAVLDNLDALVYVSDLDTYELLYMNAYGRRKWGAIDGRKCWRVLQNANNPCSFCTNHLLIASDGSPKPPHVWEFQNQLNKHWYQCRDQAIPWTNGKLVRLEIATDITDRKQMELELQEAHNKAQAAAMEDELTKLPNRRAFFQFGNRILHQALRTKSPLALVMMDLDYFKRINDTYGHQGGDEVLRKVSEVMQTRLRESDLVARMGGEEFALLLPETAADEARKITEHLLALIGAMDIAYKEQTIKSSASFGITIVSPGDQNLETLLQRADRALYRSKAKGRGRVSLYLK